MPRPRAFLVVGRADWGKSWTLRALTPKWGRVLLCGRAFFVRRMSNDDQPAGFEKFLNALDTSPKAYVVLAYCPERGSPRLLKILQRKFMVFSWVLEHDWYCTDTVSRDEIALLKEQTTKVEVFRLLRRPASMRARALRDFIARHI